MSAAEAREKHRIAEYFRQERDQLVGYTRKMIDDASDRDAEDVVQDVMLGLFDRGDVSQPLGDLASYVYRALKNRVIDIWRRKKVPVVSLDANLAGAEDLTLADVLGDTRFAADDPAEQAERKARFERAFATLTIHERAVISATEFEGRPFKELAGAWGEPLGTLLARKKRALDKIRHAIEIEQQPVKEVSHGT